MRLSSSVLVLLTILCTSASVSAQEGSASLECARGVKEACWIARFGRCANENPRIAIPACTRQLLNRNSVWTTRPDASFAQIERAQQYSLRATAHAKLGDIVEALADYDRAIRTHGELYWIHTLRGSALYAIGDDREALASFNEAVSLAPNNALLLNARGRLLATALDENVRNGPQAIADAQRASELEPGQPAYVAVLAAAYAENGEFENAAETQQRAIDLLEPGDQGAIGTYLSRLELYQQGIPFRRELLLCETIEDSLNPDHEVNSSTLLPYLTFCFAGDS